VSSIENQAKTLSDQVKLISENLGSVTPNEKKSVIFNKMKNTTNKQVACCVFFLVDFSRDFGILCTSLLIP
jgi:hypothetical protein